MKTRVSFIVVLVFLILQPLAYALAQESLSVFVSVLPQKTFVQQIGKDMVSVKVMVQPGASPATYEPKPRQMAALAKANLYFAIGVPFENTWLDKIASANPAMEVVHTDQGIEKLAMAAHHHDEGPGHEEEEHHGDEDHQGEADRHGHHGLDPHIWLAPSLVKVQADHILAALSKADPDHAGQYAANHKLFLEKITRLDADLKDQFKGMQGLKFMVFHPAWGYFAHAYGLKQVPIEIEGKDPKPAQLQELIHHAREEQIRVIFVQPQFSSKSAKVVAREIGGRVAAADPLAEDWEANLRSVADLFKDALR